MNRYRNLPHAAVVAGIVLLLAAIFVQMAIGSNDVLPQPTPTVPYNLDELATNEAQTWAVETAEARLIANTTPATEEPYVEPTWPPTPTYDPTYNGVINPGYQPIGGYYGYKWENSWASTMPDGHWIEVAAGAYVGNEFSGDRSMPPIGVLLVDMGSRDLSGEYRMDEREGSLRIVGAKGTCLDLIVVETRRSLQFDVAARKWSCNLK